MILIKIIDICQIAYDIHSPQCVVKQHKMGLTQANDNNLNHYAMELAYFFLVGHSRRYVEKNILVLVFDSENRF